MKKELFPGRTNLFGKQYVTAAGTDCWKKNNSPMQFRVLGQKKCRFNNVAVLEEKEEKENHSKRQREQTLDRKWQTKFGSNDDIPICTKWGF